MTGIPDMIGNPPPRLERAACRTGNARMLAVFFGVEREQPEAAARRAARAKQICAGCPERDTCREWAITHPTDAGDSRPQSDTSIGHIWGGTTTGERLVIRRRRNIRERMDAVFADLKPCGTSAAYRRHIRNGEPACPDCLRANAIDAAARQRTA